MNNPVGIPSGWEEIAAFEFFTTTGLVCLLKYDWNTARTTGAGYHFSYGHDWRVED